MEQKEEGVAAELGTDPEAKKQEPGDSEKEPLPPDGAAPVEEGQQLEVQVESDLRPESGLSGGSESQGEVVTIDGIPVLENIVEEAEEEEIEVEENREELIEKIMLAMEENTRLEAVNGQIQMEIAEYLAIRNVSSSV